MIHERTRNRNTLAFTATEFTRKMLHSIFKSDRFKKHFGTFATFSFTRPKNSPRNTDIFQGRKLAKQVMELENKANVLMSAVTSKCFPGKSDKK